VRTSWDNGATWGAWVSLATTQSIIYVSATTDGFYGDYQEATALVQLGAQGTALTAVKTFSGIASATGRG